MMGGEGGGGSELFTHWNILEHTATCPIENSWMCLGGGYHLSVLYQTTASNWALQCVAVHCSVLQCVAVCCSVAVC